MKKLNRIEIRVDDEFLEVLDTICRKKSGIRTRTAAIHFCVDEAFKKIKEEEQGSEGI